MENKKRRVTMIMKKPNPLFEQWLTEWMEEAKSRGSKSEFAYKIALSNLKKYKLPLQSAEECKIIKGFGSKLCQMLDNKLKEYRRNENVPKDLTPIYQSPVKKKVASPLKQMQSTNSGSKSSTYVPQTGSGGYAILLALYEKHVIEGSAVMTKSEIIDIAKYNSRVSFTKPDPGSHYTAWSSMKTLLEKGLVTKRSHPPKFSLTPEGCELAKKLMKQTENSSKTNCLREINESAAGPSVENDEVLEIVNDEPNMENLSPPIPQNVMEYQNVPTNEVVAKPKPKKNMTITKQTSSSSINSTNSSKAPFVRHASSSSITSTQSSLEDDICGFIFGPDSFDIILLVDTQETAGSNTDIEDDLLQRELQRLCVKYEVRHLTVGDYIWVCRHRLKPTHELVLPFIIERKRLDDFARSIKDGRYREQKFRLEKSGVQNVTYLIENYGNSTYRQQYVGLPFATLHQAAVNTAIQDGFYVKCTSNVRHTARYLANFSKWITVNFASKKVESCPKDELNTISVHDQELLLMTFKEFNKSSVKNKPVKVSDLFIKMLLQINGMSVEKALAVVKQYPTPLHLKQAYNENMGSKGEELLCSIPLSPALSKIIYQLFTLETFS